MIDINTSIKKIKKSYSKNIPEINALVKKRYPEFIYQSNPKTLKDEIPVFTLHTILPDIFEEQLYFLSNNDYTTLNSDEFYDCITGVKPIKERSILLTFDDGWKNVYTHSYPLLKKFGMKAVCFLIPGLVDIIYENKSLDNSERGPNSTILCDWDEIKEMHQSGVIDFQSHSMYHNLIFTSPIISDFFYPSYESFAYNFNIPLYRVDGLENLSRETQLGTPLYKNASKFAGKRRYFDDKNLREYCVEYVQVNGGKDFFEIPNWRRKLFAKVQEFNNKFKNTGYFESEDEYNENLFYDFSESKKAIEKQLPGKVVNHFCYPWWAGSESAVTASKKAGYLSNYWGVFEDKRTNRANDDPYKISRILLDDYIFRLPGENRRSLFDIYQNRFLGNFNNFVRKIL